MFDLDIQKKLKLANKLDNVSEAARISGVSRDTIYRHRRIIKEQGPEGLKRQITKDLYHKNRKNHADKTLEKKVVELSLDNPHLGQYQVSRQIKKVYKIDISAMGVRNVWLREQMQTIVLRLQKSNSMATVS